MARIFTDGAEFDDLAFWDTSYVASGTGISSSVVRTGSGVYAYTLPSSVYGGYLIKYFSAISELYFRVAIQFPALNWSSTATGIFFRSTANNVFSLYVDATGYLNVKSNGTLVATGTKVLNINTWYLFEIHLLVSDTGAIQVKVDGVLDIDYSGDTYTSYATVDNLWIGMTSYNSTLYLDDLALNDVSGGSDDSWCGDGYVLLLLPDGVGSNTDFTPSSAVDNYTLVNTLPSDGDTNYVEDGTPADYDLYTVDNIDLTDKYVQRVWVEARARDTAAVGATMKLDLLSGATLSKSSDITLAGTYTRIVGPDYTTDPDTGTTWTEIGINGLEAGPEVS